MACARHVDKITGEIHKKVHETPQPPKYQMCLGNTMVELTQQNRKDCRHHARHAIQLIHEYHDEGHAEPCFDVGIAEHAVTFSAGLKPPQGLVPFCNIYSSFMQRAYDQVIHDVCIQNLPVNFCLDGCRFWLVLIFTHHGAYDIAYFRCLPTWLWPAPYERRRVAQPDVHSSTSETRKSIFYPLPTRTGVMPNWRTPSNKSKSEGKKDYARGQDIAILTIGHIGNYAVDALR